MPDPTAGTIGKAPPQNLDAEGSVLGSMVLDNDCIDTVADMLTGDSFYKSAHGTIFKAILSLHRRRKSVDFVLLKTALGKLGLLESVGGAAYLAELMEAVPSAGRAEQYAEEVRETAELRDVIRSCAKAQQDAYEGARPAIEIVSEHAERIARVGRIGREPSQMTDVIGRTYKAVFSRSLQQGWSTGLKDLDDKCGGGLIPGYYYIFASRPHIGKTALANNIAMQLDGPRVLYFSLETHETQMGLLWMSIATGVTVYRIRKNWLTDDEHKKMVDCLTRAQTWDKIHFDDISGLTDVTLRARCAKHKAKHGLDVVMIDYVQLMQSAEKASGRHEALENVSAAIRRICKDLNVAVVVLAQLRRAVSDQSKTRWPTMDEVKGSGQFEQDADVIVLLHRPKYDGESDEEKNECWGLGVKNKITGSLGRFRFDFRHKTMRFSDWQDDLDKPVVDLPGRKEDDGRGRDGRETVRTGDTAPLFDDEPVNDNARDDEVPF